MRMSVVEKCKTVWNGFNEKHSKAAKLIQQFVYFWIFSMGVTVFQYLVFTFLPGILGTKLAGVEFMVPKIQMDLFGVKFTWSLLGYNVLYDSAGNVLIGGGLGYFISFWHSALIFHYREILRLRAKETSFIRLCGISLRGY